MEHGDIEVPVQSDSRSCSSSSSVSGMLALTLRISRVFGIAPVSFQKTGTDPPKIIARVSRRHAIYGYVFITIINLLVFFPTYILWTEKTDTIGLVINTFDISALMLITSMGAYGAAGRISRMLHHLDKLNKITSKQTAVKTNEMNERKVTIIIALTILAHVTVKTAVALVDGVQELSRLSFIVYAVQGFMCMLIVVYIILMVSAVVSTLETLLIQLQNLPTLVEIEDPNNSIIIASSNLDTVRKKQFQQICESYEVVCGVVRDLNDTEGLLLFNTIATVTLYCIVSIFNIINVAVLGTEETNYFFAVEVCWSVTNIVLLLTFVELCHQAEQKALKIRYLLSDALPEVVAVAPVTSWSFKMAVHCDSLLLNRLVFAPLNIVEFNRFLVANVISFVASSLVIIVQYKMSLVQNSR